MNRKTFSFFSSRGGIISTGAIIGIIAVLLQKFGNPKNMGVCVACFVRDITGALGLHRAAVVQYLRPEIMGFVIGSCIAALIFKEFKGRGGSSPIIRFFLGVFAMLGALMFLGCPWRALLRLAGGDLNGITALLGLTAGISIGVLFLKKGYSLGRSVKTSNVSGFVFPGFMIILLLFAAFRVSFIKGGAIFYSESGPGSLYAPLLVSLGAGLIIGFLAQRSRFCTMGALRDIILMRDTHLASGVGALLIAAFIMNIVLGQTKFGFTAQPVAHSAHLINFFGMLLSGLAFALAGGCPGRQLFLSGEGDGDAAVFVMGMVFGAAFSHNFGLAGRADALKEGILIRGGVSAASVIAMAAGILFCLIVGFTHRQGFNKQKEA